MLAGVASGLADYFDVDPTIVRIAFVALAAGAAWGHRRSPFLSTSPAGSLIPDEGSDTVGRRAAGSRPRPQRLLNGHADGDSTDRTGPDLQTEPIRQAGTGPTDHN